MSTTGVEDSAEVELAGTVDVTNLELNQEEAFLISRLIGRRQKVGEVVATAGMPAAKVRRIIAKLAAQGAVKLFAKVVVEDGGKAAAADDYEGVVFSPNDIAEVCEITLEQKKRILYVAMHLEKWNHYALLGLKRTATAGDVKKGYFKASKEFHPDRFFRKELGSYRKRIDAIFKSMKTAYDVLNRKESRQEYDQTELGSFTPEEEAELQKIAEEHKKKASARDREDRHKERMANRRKKRNPMLDRIKRAKGLLAEAEAAMTAKKYADGGRLAKLAMDFAPRSGEVKRGADAIIAGSNVERARVLAKRADAVIASKENPEVVEAAEKIAELAPEDPELLLVAARLAESGQNVKRAIKYAQTASQHKDSVKVWTTLLHLCEGAEVWNTAIRAAEALVRLEPDKPKHKERLKHARRSAKG